jgi:hypothetical protein
VALLLRIEAPYVEKSANQRSKLDSSLDTCCCGTTQTTYSLS